VLLILDLTMLSQIANNAISWKVSSVRN